MAVYSNFSLIKYEDGILSVSLTNPTNINSWNIQFSARKRFGSCTPLITKSADATYHAGQSGITYTNGPQGQFNVAIASVDTSGIGFGNLAFAIERLDVGNRTDLAEGFLLVLPSIEC